MKRPTKVQQYRAIYDRICGKFVTIGDGLRAEEIAAALLVDVDLAFKAVAWAVAQGYLVDKGARGIFHASVGM